MYINFTVHLCAKTYITALCPYYHASRVTEQYPFFPQEEWREPFTSHTCTIYMYTRRSASFELFQSHIGEKFIRFFLFVNDM